MGHRDGRFPIPLQQRLSDGQSSTRLSSPAVDCVLLPAHESLRERRRKMKRATVFLITSAAVLLFTIAHPAQGQTINTQVTLSCNDGHSVIFNVDQITLTSLLTDVQAINASGTGTSCTLTMAAIDPSSQTTEWTVYDYNPSNQAIAPRNSPNSMPATTSGDTTTFQFKAGIYTALLTTTDPSLTGDLSIKTLTDTISVSGGSGTFKYR